MKVNNEVLNRCWKTISDVIDELHSETDQSALLISEDIRYRVHKFLIEFKDRFSLYDMMGDWDEIQLDPSDDSRKEYIISNRAACELPTLRTHEEAVDVYGIFYIFEERDLASKLSLDYTEIPEHYCDNYDLDGVSYDEDGNPKDLSQFRCTDSELNPQMLYMDYVTRILKNAFRIEFPEMEKFMK